MTNKRKKDSEHESLTELINRHLDIKPDILPGGVMIAIRGRNSMTVSGSVLIQLYTPTEIKLSLSHGALSIKGKRLVCISYNAEELSIDGEIDSVSFLEE